MKIHAPAARDLLIMWTKPRLIASFFMALAMIAAPRLLFFFAQPLPYYVQFNPGCAAIPLAGILFGPAGVWGAVAGTILADLMVGLGTALTPFRAMGAGLFALSAALIWNRGKLNDSTAPARQTRPAWRFLGCVLPGMAMDAVWLGFGSEWLRLYPFSYVTTLTLIQHAIFVPFVGIPVMRWLDRQGARISPFTTALSRRGQGLLIASAWGAWLIGSWIAYRRYHIAPLDPFVIGVTDCPVVLAAVLPFLPVQLWACFLPVSRTGRI